MSNILVTGGLGFIGSNFISKKLGEENFIVNIDSETNASIDKSYLDFESNQNYRHYNIDIADFQKVNKIIKKYSFDIIFHFAAESHVDNSIENSFEFCSTNVIGTLNLLESYRKLNKKHKLFIHVSTDEVFGSIKDGFFDENSNYKPNSPYSASKAAGDLLVRSWNKTFKLPTITTHCSNNYGPWQNPEKLIPLVINNILHNKKIPIYGNGKNIRDWIYVEDHVEALIKISKLKFNGQVYNIGSNNLIDNLSLVKKICNIIDKKLNYKMSSKNLIKFVKDRKGHDLKYAIDSKLLYKDTKFLPKIKFIDGLEKTIEWYLDNKKWLYKK